MQVKSVWSAHDNGELELLTFTESFEVPIPEISRRLRHSAPSRGKRNLIEVEIKDLAL
jgi:hypothetical protein